MLGPSKVSIPRSTNYATCLCSTKKSLKKQKERIIHWSSLPVYRSPIDYDELGSQIERNYIIPSPKSATPVTFYSFVNS